MRNPILNNASPFNGVKVMEVEPGTVIKDERSGKSKTVTDDTVVFKGNVMFCTKPMVDRLKREVKPA